MSALDWKREWRPLILLAGGFLAVFFLPVGTARFDHAILEAFHLARWYAREHVLLCLVPAFFIAGGIGVFVSQASVMRYLGARANPLLAYGVASVSGTVLAVCSCTVLPLFAGIYRMGAGLGPAATFLYSGPAINVLAIILTARILGAGLGAARAIGAVVLSIIIGVCMHLLFRREEEEKARLAAALPEPPQTRPLWQTASFFASLVAILVFANWGRPGEGAALWAAVYSVKWWLTGLAAALLGIFLATWFRVPVWRLVIIGGSVAALALLVPRYPAVAFAAGALGLSFVTSRDRGETGDWFESTWSFAKQILPLLLLGVLISGAALGRPGAEGLIPSAWVNRAVGGNSITANLFAAVAGAFMYFATLTEVPILQGLIGSGMGQGPALSLLLAGPALSLPSMLVIRTLLGTRKALAFIALVIVMSTIAGLLYGAIVS
jgi:uncharacterized membrane protein YraQ (UPF0718 family)